MDKELAPEVADTLRRFKVIIALCGVSSLPPEFGFQPSLVDKGSWRQSTVVKQSEGGS